MPHILHNGLGNQIYNHLQGSFFVDTRSGPLPGAFSTYPAQEEINTASGGCSRSLLT